MPPSTTAANPASSRVTPVGAEFSAKAGGTHFRLWAPQCRSVSITFDSSRHAVEMSSEQQGYFSAFAEGVNAGMLYKYQVDDDEYFPDPASRYQPTGPHGFSEIIDPSIFTWSDQNWLGIQLAGQVIYEMHLGTFTKGGTWNAASKQLQALKDLGITVLEIMPVAEFPGRFGWGYDGVQPYAPAAIYGTPDDMRSFVDRAHATGLAVILDVVYNHIGPDGNYLTKFSPYYLSNKHTTDWGKGLNFDGENSNPVREFFRENAAYWIRDFHLDGLRFDATQDIHDESPTHILAEIGKAARQAAGKREIILVGENERQDTRLLKPLDSGGYGLDALWNDDFHHSAVVALTGRADAYYTDYRGSSQELLSAVKYGFLYQGQLYRWQHARRGHSTLGIPRAAMITFIENHDQVANSSRGQRLLDLSAPGAYRAMTALMLLSPGTPMLFQGQEFGASNPFLYFADHTPDLADKVKKGRKEFLAQWRTLRQPRIQHYFADPASHTTFELSQLDHSKSSRNEPIHKLFCDLLRLRREDEVISRQGQDGLDGAVLSPHCFIVRFFNPRKDEDRLLVVNLGIEMDFNPAPEPLLAPPEGKYWRILWSSEDPSYGGDDTGELDSDDNWHMPGNATVLLQAEALLK